jgi:hypothetical protein
MTDELNYIHKNQEKKRGREKKNCFYSFYEWNENSFYEWMEGDSKD